MSGSSDSAPKPDYCLETRQSSRGYGVETVVVEGVLRIRTFLVLCEFSHNFPLGMPCAGCDRRAPYIPLHVDDDSLCQIITVCPACNAGICGQCTEFIENYHIAKGKLCRYCGTDVAPLDKISLKGPRPLSLRQLIRARNQFYTFSRWLSSVRSKNRDFRFSGIFWESYFNHLSWRFFVDAEWFFDQQLPGQLKIVIAGMYFNGSHLLNMEFRKGFAGPYHDFHKDAAEGQPPNFMFPQLKNFVKMNSFAFKMLEKMKVKVCVLRSIRRQLITFWERKVSIGLGINIPEVNYPEDSLSFWR
jgi:hypothetical protein